MGRLKFTIVHVGKLRESYVKDAFERYRKQMSAYASLELRVLKQEPVRKRAAINSIYKKEAERMDKILSAYHTIIALDASGQTFTSPDFAQYLHVLENEGRSDITFLVGGPVGLSPEIVTRSYLSLSLSPMTFSHELTILALVEQLYRAVAYLHNHPYPK